MERDEIDLSEKAPELLRRKRFWVLLLVCLMVGGVAIFRFVTRVRIKAELNAIRAAGLPRDSVELDRWAPPVETRENAALEILNAARLYSALPSKQMDYNWPKRGAALPTATEQILELLVATNKEAHAIVHRAAGLPRSRYPIDWTPGPNTLLPHLAKVKELHGVCRAQATLAIERGETSRAVESIVDSFGLAHSLIMEPALISHLVRISILIGAVATVEHLLNRSALSEQEIVRLLGALKDSLAEDQDGMRRALVGERCEGVYIFEMPWKKLADVFAGTSQSDLPVFYPLFQLAGLHDLDQLFFLRTMGEWIEISREPFPASWGKLKEWDARRQRELGRMPPKRISQLILPSSITAWEKLGNMEAQLRAAEAALGVESYRLRHGGELPESLVQLAPGILPEAPKDPYDGQPLRLEWLKPGYEIYSVGADGKDDGGVEPEKRAAEGAPKDIVFKVSR